jgi:formate dehydrogenase subunit gamma
MADPSQEPILRHSVAERVAHWAVAMVFLFLFFSGLALFHPIFFWLAGLFGGGPLMRWLHPITGVVLAVLFFWYAARLARDNRWLATDQEWTRHMWAYMRKEYEPKETAKYNAGQKLMYWSMVPIIAVLLLTGIALWQPWFAPAFPPAVRRVASLLHGASAFVVFVGIGVHVYAAIWTRGSITSMVRGTVSQPWARFHHPAWYREITGKRP